MKTYYGINIECASSNASGMRWHAMTDSGQLRADTLDGMRKLIRAQRPKRPAMTRDEWRVELTDTFGGEPNFGWIKRATFTTRAGASQRAIVREAKRALDLCGRWDTESYGDTYTLRARGACLVAFITPVYP